MTQVAQAQFTMFAPISGAYNNMANTINQSVNKARSDLAKAGNFTNPMLYAYKN